ncbi:LysE/ArgO family amino acid transporter [Paramicrobacterium humi]|uniref:LysE/ArgO family amino acid transporter n=1 Tax=Paramicrobacterium humi TaxID=640635 RepID=UPI001FE23E25|nr:LysE/ArgO family amino acid transporter [Microbacterium humi]
MISALVSGLLAGWSLIIAVGPQNAYVLRQGIRREHVTIVVALCIAADVALIAAGALGIGALVEAVPLAASVLKWAGAAYLVWFAITRFVAAAKRESLEQNGERMPRRSVVTVTLALTFLNPGVYLDTIVMLGTLANRSGAQGPWPFAIGAMLGSISWFTALGYGSHRLAPLLAKPRAWQILDVTIGVVILALAVRLVLM